MSERTLQLSVRHYQIPRNYGPGMKCQDGVLEGYREKSITKKPGQCGLVLVHCWNLGEESGPYPISEGQELTGTNSDWVVTAGEITKTRIAPALEAARDIGMPVFHVAAPGYAHKYPQYLRLLGDDELQGPDVDYEGRQCIRPKTVNGEWGERFGEGWPGAVWETHPESFNIAESVRPRDEEDVVLDGWQLSGLCRRLEVDTLIFAGFMANICLLHVPGAMIEMSHKFRYQCVVLRDCTVAHEHFDTLPNLDLTKAALRYIEVVLGYSTSSGEFIRACRESE